jgi:2'-5' RNA ligase
MFVAVVPPDEVRDELSDFLEPRQQADSTLRWTAPEQWHITLAFLPSVAERHLDEMVERLGRAAARRHSFPLELGGAGTFPNPARARALWAAVHGDTDHLSQLATGARAAAAKAGTEVDGGRFQPHLTLARLNRPLDLTKWLRIFDTYAGRPWQVTEVGLIESHLGEGPRRRPRYETVESFPLTPR